MDGIRGKSLKELSALARTGSSLGISELGCPKLFVFVDDSAAPNISISAGGYRFIRRGPVSFLLCHFLREKRYPVLTLDGSEDSVNGESSFRFLAQLHSHRSKSAWITGANPTQARTCASTRSGSEANIRKVQRMPHQSVQAEIQINRPSVLHITLGFLWVAPAR